jgi:phospholipid/cholesterol/gamma-HCH transport system permease protein
MKQKIPSYERTSGHITENVKAKEVSVRKPNSIEVFFGDVGNATKFVLKVIQNMFGKDFEFNQFLKQCFAIGNQSLGLISVTGIIIGLVLTIQSRPVLVNFGAVSMLPGMVAISIIREMGPVITALICAGKIGSSMGAEIGSMRVTEQIDAMEVSSTNPIKFLIVPRVLAAILCRCIVHFRKLGWGKY